MESDVQNGAVPPPRGIYPGRVDEKGRLKPSTGFQQHLASLGEHFFITSFDRKIARIYPLSVWAGVEEMFRNPGENADMADVLWFRAMELGAEAELDSQGRLLLSPELRRALNIENAPVYLVSVKGHIEVFGKEVLEERQREAEEKAGTALKHYERLGLR